MSAYVWSEWSDSDDGFPEYQASSDTVGQNEYNTDILVNKNGQDTASQNEHDTVSKNEHDEANQNEHDTFYNQNECATVKQTSYDAVNQNEYDTVNQNEHDTDNQNEYDTLNQNEYDAVNQSEYDTVNQNECDAVNQNEYDTVSQNEYDAVNQNEYDAVNQNEYDAVNQNEYDTVSQNKHDTVSQNKHDTDNQNEYNTVNQNEYDTVNQNEYDTVSQNEHYAVNQNEHDTVNQNENNIVNQNEHDKVNQNKHDIVNQNEHDTVIQNNHETVLQNEYDTVIQNESDAVNQNEHDAVNQNEHDIVSQKEQQDTVNQNESDAVNQDERDTVYLNEQVTVIQNERETVNLNEQDTVYQNERDAVSQNEHDGVNQNERDGVNQNEHDTINQNEHGTINQNEHDTVNQNEHDTINQNEQDTVNQNEQDTVNQNEQDTVNQNEQDTVNQNEHDKVNQNEHDTVNHKEHDNVNQNKHVSQHEIVADNQNEHDTDKTEVQYVTIENSNEIPENSCTLDKIQHQVTDNANVSNDTELLGSSSESIIATSIPQSTKREKKFKKRRGRKKAADTMGHGHDNNIQSTKPHQKRQRRSRPSKKYVEQIASSLEDDIPLADIKYRNKMTLEQHDDSDNDKTFKPSARDNNSTDTEYSSYLSDAEKMDRHMKKTLLKDFEVKSQKEVKAKQQIHIKQRATSAQRQQKARNVIKGKQDYANKCLNQTTFQSPLEKRGNSSQSNTFELIERVKSQSRKEVEHQNTIHKTHQDRLDQLLFSNGLKRVRVNAYGNCFFEAVAFSLNNISAPSLCEKLCQHLDENMEQYIGFLLQQGSPEDELEFVSQYCREIEQLKSDGYWSNKAGDFLPLPLSNWTKRRVVIYTSKPEQPIIDIHPADVSSMMDSHTEVIPLAYTSAPGISEHYDACRKMTVLDPLSSDQKTGEDRIPDNHALDPNAANDNQIRLSATEQEAINMAGTPGTMLRDNLPPIEHVEEEHYYTAEPLIDQLDKIITPQSTPKKGHNEKSPSNNTFTPRKAAKFVTPEKRQLTRKRKAAPETWKKNIRKKLRLSGQEYTSPQSGKKIPRKEVKPPCTNCRCKCTSVFSEEDRKKYLIHFGT